MVFEKEIKLLPQQVPSFTDAILKKFGLNDDIFFDVKLALNEALVNAIKHGNKSDKNRPVYLQIKKDGQKLVVWVKDQGRGFPYSQLKLPTNESNLTRHSGRGVFLIRNFMDKIDFFEGGSKIKMVKYLSKEE